MLKALDPDGDNIEFFSDDLPENARFENGTFIWTPDYDFVQKEGLLDSLLEKLRLLSKTEEVTFTASSNDLETTKQVRIIVKDVNQPFALDPIEDIVINEGEEVVIEPRYLDPDGDKVTFKYSGFMITNHKQTSVGDAGQYVVQIDATDGYYKQRVFVNIIVRDVNQAPLFASLRPQSVGELQEVRIPLDATDPDGDKITFSANDLPLGAKIQKKEFVWTAVIGEGNKRDYIFDITASDGVASVTQQLHLTVTDVNQPPRILDASNTLVAVAGEPVMFEVIVEDADSNALTYEWDFGLFDKYEGGNAHTRLFKQQGDKKVTVTVSDGTEEVQKTWKVKVV